MQTIKQMALTPLTGKQSRALGAGIYRYCRESNIKLGEFCRIVDVPPTVPSSLYLKKQHKYATPVVQAVVKGLGYDELPSAVTYGLNADTDTDKPPVVNGKKKKTWTKRKRGKVAAGEAIKTPSVSTFAEQLNSLSKEDAEKVKKLVMYLYQKATMAALEQEIKSF